MKSTYWSIYDRMFMLLWSYYWLWWGWFFDGLNGGGGGKWIAKCVATEKNYCWFYKNKIQLNSMMKWNDAFDENTFCCCCLLSWLADLNTSFLLLLSSWWYDDVNASNNKKFCKHKSTFVVFFNQKYIESKMNFIFAVGNFFRFSISSIL